eukprot:TRINITY_DN9720_c1_g1_i1.p1 TRINITY_DN9720_c1_g1~~TRINITY_DN9720_c1_g1_i1.p1  ORF type:complete len:993 (+),score=213.01 TRINITY_DN9720_c1_g1_i1:53-2980(+)
MAPSPAAKLSVEGAWALQKELLAAFSNVGFQLALEELQQSLAVAEPKKFQAERKKLVRTAQLTVLPRYGFEANDKGVQDMMRRFSEKDLTTDARFVRMGETLQRLLGEPAKEQHKKTTSSGGTHAPVAPPAIVRAAAAARLAQAERNDVGLKKPTPSENMPMQIMTWSDGQPTNTVAVTVAGDASMRDVKAAMAQKLGNSDVLRGRLVRKSGSSVTPFADEEKVGSRRKLSLFGVNIPSMTLQPESPDATQEAVQYRVGTIPVPGGQHAQMIPAEMLSSAASTPANTIPNGAQDSKPNSVGIPSIAAPSLTIARALSLLGELHACFCSIRFQANMSAVIKFATSKTDMEQGRTKLIVTALRDLLPRYGFEPSSQGYMLMLSIVKTYSKSNDKVASLRDQIRSVLGCGLEDFDLSTLGLVTVPPALLDDMAKKAGMSVQSNPGADVEVRLRHKSNHAELYVTVPSNCTMSDVLAAAAIKVGNDAIRAAGRIVKPEAGSLKVYEADESLGARRRLLFLGPAFIAAGGPRKVTVRLEHSEEQVSLTLDAGAMVLDVRRSLQEQHGVPHRAALMVKTKQGLLAQAQDADRPKSMLVLRGVLTLGSETQLLEGDVLEALQEINERYEAPDFQHVVKSWQEARGQESVVRMKELRDRVDQVTRDIIPKYGFEASVDAIKRWSALVDAFQRFPAVAELCRKSRVLAGTLSPDVARRQAFGRPWKKVCPGVCDVAKQHGLLTVSEITSEEALVAERGRAARVIDLLYRRIYEENRNELWQGGQVKGHNMPTRKAVARAYLEPIGTVLLETLKSDGTLVGAAAVYSVAIEVPPSLFGKDDFGESASILMDEASELEEEGDGDQDANAEDHRSDEEAQETPKLAVGYINALAAVDGSHAGSALLQHINRLAEEEGWDMIVLHSILVESTLRFWERRGFEAYGSGKETHFRLACMQHNRFALSKRTVEGHLPPRPGCLLFAKFIDK